MDTHCRELFEAEDLAEPQVELTQSRREPGTGRDQRDRLCPLCQVLDRRYLFL